MFFAQWNNVKKTGKINLNLISIIKSEKKMEGVMKKL